MKIKPSFLLLLSLLINMEPASAGFGDFIRSLISSKRERPYQRVEMPADNDFDIDLEAEHARTQLSIVDIVVSINSKARRLATQDELNAIDELLKAGAAVDERDKQWGSTPLMFAVQRGDEGLTSLLLSHGANASAKNNGKAVEAYAKTVGTLIQIAQAKNSVVTLVSGINYGHGRKLSEFERNIVVHLLDNHADVDEYDSRFRSTSLMFAAQRGDIELVSLLLERGADLTLTGDAGYTAYRFASNNVLREMLRYF